MNKLLTAFALLVLIGVAPLMAYAHASPIEYSPASSEGLTEAPSEVRIRFSERLEPGASRIVVKDAQGADIAGASVIDPADPRVLVAPLSPTESEGAYYVTWSVVSADDGHFTKGGYAYFIGEEASAQAAVTPQVEVVQLSAIPEATAMFVELLGNSLLWGALILLAFVFRGLTSKLDEVGNRHLRRLLDLSIASGVLLVLGGAVTHTVMKTLELSTLHGISMVEAFPLYIATVSGSATIGRAAVALTFGTVFLVRRSALLAARRVTVSEVALLLLLLAFAYLRAKVSHATANPFLPDLSVAVNVIHLIGKDLWAGLLGVLSVALLSRPLARVVPELLDKGFRLAIIASAFVGASATYIVWLHLKDFGNISSTLWGERFVPLLIAALLAVALLAYHVLANRYRPQFMARFLRYTLPAEFGLGVLIVFFSSLMIITSPPLVVTGEQSFSASDQGVHIRLEAAPYEDEAALLTLESRTRAVGEPIVMIGTDVEDALLIDLEERFLGGYVFPASVLPEAERTLTVTVPQEGGYDAHARFEVERADLIAVERHDRSLDMFTIIMIMIGLASVLFAAVLYRIASPVTLVPAPASSLSLAVGFVVTLLAASQLMGLAHMVFGNTFKRECVADGNAWHLMLPSRNGIPVSTIPEEGCMALGGSFHIADAREYRYLRAPGASSVVFSTDLEALEAGKPTELAFTIANEAGEPSLLSVTHEKLAHLIILSADTREFWHVHPEQVGPASFTIPFTFPREGTYLIALDYAHGLTPTSEHIAVQVGAGAMEAPETYPAEVAVEGYDVRLSSPLVFAGEMATLSFTIERDGKGVTDLEPYLAAAMHLAIVKHDLSEFIHTHGEVHPPGTPPLPAPSASTVHQHSPPPARFGPVIEAHAIFPTPGLYTVFGEFNHEGKIVTAKFTVRVE